MKSYCRPSFRASSTCRVASMISGPMPSPRITAMVWVMRFRFRWTCRQPGRPPETRHYARAACTPPYWTAPQALTSSVGMARVDAGCGLARFQPVEEIHGPAQVRDDDRAAHHQAHRKGLEHGLAADPGLAALGNVVADAIVATQYQGGDQAQ